MEQLPIEAVLGELRRALGACASAVLQAPPGAGKTTGVPLALLGEPWLAGGRILMLEPRRLAARAAARRMAQTLGEAVGEQVGFRVRGETQVGPRTRIEVLTEGVLTRMLQRDPGLTGVGLVIFDEFHERSLHADLGLALTLQARALLRPDLRVLVMSATLQGQAVAALLGDAPVITSEGRTWPVALHYLARPAERIEPAVAGAVRRALAEEAGDVLVFLPGAAEIHRLHQVLFAEARPHVDLYPLHGTLPAEQQDRAIRPSPPGRRKVVIATSIAETSLTIDGVRVVVDSGLMRVPRFSPRTGMSRLETVRVTRASAEQRAGRAGRTAPGICHRLWTEAEHAALLAHGAPEILASDLAPLALELAAWGADDPAELAWLDAPPAAAYAQARELLRELEALDHAGRITAHGRALAALPVHPRLAHMLLRAQPLGAVPLACRLAALLGERDLFRRGDVPADPDVRLRLDALRTGRGPIDNGVLQRVRREAAQLERHFQRGAAGGRPGSEDAGMVGLLLAFAYPERIAQRRSGSADRVLLRNGRGAVLAGTGALARSDFMVAAQLEDSGRESRIFSAAPLDRERIEQHFAADIEVVRVVEWDDAAGAVRSRERRRLGALVLEDRQVPAGPEEIGAALAGALRRLGLGALGWTRDAVQLRERLAFAHHLAPAEWPDVSERALLDSLEHWLLPFAPGARTLADLARVDPAAALTGLLDWRQRRALDELAPTHQEVPTGSRIAIDYADPEAPVLAVRLQELFGLADTPRIAHGRVPLTLHLLSPARRPVQVTRDLASFWRSTYFDVRKDLKGRYPKHSWPDDPLTAEPTRRTKPRGSRGES